MKDAQSNSQIGCMRCVECGELHEGECAPGARLAFAVDCALDILDELAGAPPEPGSRRWMIAQGEYPADAWPTEGVHLNAPTELA